jgi:hypothetical protein
MQRRREFLKSIVMGVASAVSSTASTSLAQRSATTAVNKDDRNYWLEITQRIATPVLTSLSRRELKKRMPAEARNPTDRIKYAHLEAFGRLLAGIAPWLAAQGLDQSELRLQQNLLHLAQASLDAATDPSSPDFMNFHDGSQPLVDAAFLAQGILRAPSVLWEPLEARVRRQIVEAMKSSRAIPTPTSNNWVMFAAMVEALLKMRGEKTIEDRFEGCVHRMLSWYKEMACMAMENFFTSTITTVSSFIPCYWMFYQY